jgi:hypothetical protein
MMEAHCPDAFEGIELVCHFEGGRRACYGFPGILAASSPRMPDASAARNSKQLARRLTPAEARALHRQHDAYVSALKLVDRRTIKGIHTAEMAYRKLQRKLRTSNSVPSEKPVHAHAREIARRLRQMAAAAA